MQAITKSALFTASLGLLACSSTNFGGANGSSPAVSKAETPAVTTTPTVTADATAKPATSPSSGSLTGSVGTGSGTSDGVVSTGGGSSGTAAGFPIGNISVTSAKAPSYSNTASQLYSYAPANGGLPVLIGNFTLNSSPITNVYDTAIDMAGHLFAVTPTDLYVVDPTTADMTHLLSHNVKNAMGLTCLSNGAIVIAGDSVAYVDPTSLAEQTLVPAGQYTTSGDVVALPDHNIYWTVTSFLGDSLVVINPLTGATKMAGNTGITGIFGLSYANGALYGFVQNGDIVTLNPSNGQVLSHVAGTSSQPWDGATTNPVLW